MRNIATDSASPIPTIMSQDDIIAVLKGERNYQKRRWGVRQEDGTMLEVEHNCFDNLAYCYDYNLEALRDASRAADDNHCLDTLRKVVAIAVASLETQGLDAYEELMPEKIEVPECAAVTFFILAIQGSIMDAVDAFAATPAATQCEAAILTMRSIIDLGMRCFMQFGVPGRRDLDIVVNGRDNKPA